MKGYGMRRDREAGYAPLAHVTPKRKHERREVDAKTKKAGRKRARREMRMLQEP